MIKLLPIVVIIILILGGLGYWRFIASKEPLTSEVASEPIEVPKILPEATLADRVKILEDLITKMVGQLNSLKAQGSKAGETETNSKLNSLDAAITELKARVSSLENSSSTTTTSGKKSPLYIPLGTGGSGTNSNWLSLEGYEVSLDPADYNGYSSMQLEVTMRVIDPAGKALARLYNATDGVIVSSEFSTTSTSFTLLATSATISSGRKTYHLQIKSIDKEVIVQSASIKVSF